MNNTMPVWPFMISTGVLFIAVIILLIKLSKKSQLSEDLLRALKFAKGLWKTTLQYSVDYMNALEIGENELVFYEMNKNIFVVQIGTEEKKDMESITIFAKNTSCGGYGDDKGWRVVLQAREETLHSTSGGGTSYIAVLEPEKHAAVIEAIKAGKYSKEKW